MGLSPEDKVVLIPQLRRRLLAACETGNTGAARTLIAELQDVDVEEARKLRADVISAYGIDVAA